MTKQAIGISYCTTCKGRLHQLRQTLESNLTGLADDEEIVLVDYQSEDGLAPWVWDGFSGEIEQGRLRFFEVRDQTIWNAPKAKNLAYRLARGSYLFNLDGDNFLTAEDREMVRKARDRGIGCRQGTGNLRDGTPGRIGMHRKTFFGLGGYDESLMGVTLDDYDLIVRAEAAGYRFWRLPPPKRLPVQNDDDERVGNIVKAREITQGDLSRIGQVNRAISKLRLELEGPARRQNFASFRGRLNGKPVLVHGFGRIPLQEQPSE